MSYLLTTTPIPLPQPLATIDLLPVSEFACFGSYTGKPPYMAFCVWLLAPSIMFSRFICIVVSYVPFTSLFWSSLTGRHPNWTQVHEDREFGQFCSLMISGAWHAEALNNKYMPNVDHIQPWGLLLSILPQTQFSDPSPSILPQPIPPYLQIWLCRNLLWLGFLLGGLVRRGCRVRSTWAAAPLTKAHSSRGLGSDTPRAVGAPGCMTGVI